MRSASHYSTFFYIFSFSFPYSIPSCTLSHSDPFSLFHSISILSDVSLSPYLPPLPLLSITLSHTPLMSLFHSISLPSHFSISSFQLYLHHVPPLYFTSPTSLFNSISLPFNTLFNRTLSSPTSPSLFFSSLAFSLYLTHVPTLSITLSHSSPTSCLSYFILHPSIFILTLFSHLSPL